MALFALTAFLPAAVLAMALVPLARRVAVATNLVAGVRSDRLHREATPLGGGMALAATVLVVTAAAWAAAASLGPGRAPHFLPSDAMSRMVAAGPLLVRIGLGGLLFFVIGMLDDRYDLPAWAKLGLQVLAAGEVVVGFGISATVHLPAPAAGEAVSILWIVAVVNAVNMFDHADGFAAASASVALVMLAVGQTFVGGLLVPGLALVTAGALVGFLVYNLPPARLFMGDAGSMLVGYLLASLTILGRYWRPGAPTTAVLAPLALLAVPLADAAGVTLLRVFRGQSPLRGDATSHLAHRLLAAGWTPGGALALASLASALAGVGSLMLYFHRAYLAGVGFAYAALAVLVTWTAQRFGGGREEQT